MSIPTLFVNIKKNIYFKFELKKKCYLYINTTIRFGIFYIILTLIKEL